MKQCILAVAVLAFTACGFFEASRNADLRIVSWSQSFVAPGYGAVIADYELRNQGTMDIEWAKAVFTASCTDATRYSTEAVILWGYEPDITTGQVKAGSVIIDTFAKEATAIEAMVSDYY